VRGGAGVTLHGRPARAHGAGIALQGRVVGVPSGTERLHENSGRVSGDSGGVHTTARKLPGARSFPGGFGRAPSGAGDSLNGSTSLPPRPHDISALTACATELHTRFAAATAAKATADQAIIDKNASRARAEVVARAAIRRQKASTALQRGARRPVPRAGRRRLDRHDGRQARAHARRYGAVQEVAFLRGRLGLAAGARGAVSSRLLLSSQHVLLDRWRSV
jgi:hypothetical protein